MNRSARRDWPTLLAVVATVVLLGVVAVGVGAGAGIGAGGGAGAGEWSEGEAGAGAGTGAEAGDVDGVGADADAAAVEGFAAAQDVDADRVVLRAEVDEAGAAAWRIEYRIRLDSDDREAAFDDLEADVRENESAYAARYEDRMASTAAAAEEATGREMAITGMAVSTERESFPEETGVLVYEFEWTGFAAVDGDRLEFGDAIGGLFLEEGYQLTLRWPADHDLQTAVPSPDETGDRSVTWRGPKDFDSDEPRVTVARPSVFGGSGLWTAGIIVATIVASLLFWRREAVRGALGVGEGTGRGTATGAGADGAAGESPAGAEGPSGSTASGGATVPDANASEANASGSAGSAEATESAESTGSAGSTGSDGSAGSVETTEPPEELLSNEERVVRLLEERGGRMKQQDVVQALGWTDARTSQVVSGLREEGTIEGFRLGRENVLRLPEADEVEPGDGADDETDDGAGD